MSYQIKNNHQEFAWMNDCPVFVSSADSYADIWPVFFDLFKMNWPEYNGIIYLNTEEKTFHKEGLNIECTRVGKLGNFGRVFRAGLDQIKSDQLLFMMIDYIFMGKVNHLKLSEYYDYFIATGIDSLCLIHQNYTNLKPTELQDINMVALPSHDMFSYQIALWKKQTLYEMALPHENPWTSEWFGTQRANKMKMQLGCLTEDTEAPISYDPGGCLRKGQWVENAIDYLNAINYDVNIKNRGYFKELSPTIKERWNMKLMFIKDGFKGSYWDLLKRKNGQGR